MTSPSITAASLRVSSKRIPCSAPRTQRAWLSCTQSPPFREGVPAVCGRGATHPPSARSGGSLDSRIPLPTVPSQPSGSRCVFFQGCSPGNEHTWQDATAGKGPLCVFVCVRGRLTELALCCVHTRKCDVVLPCENRAEWGQEG